MDNTTPPDRKGLPWWTLPVLYGFIGLIISGNVLYAHFYGLVPINWEYFWMILTGSAALVLLGWLWRLSR